jgi:hypothetical protein
MEGQQTRGVADADEFVSAHYRRFSKPGSFCHMEPAAYNSEPPILTASY